MATKVSSTFSAKPFIFIFLIVSWPVPFHLGTQAKLVHCPNSYLPPILLPEEYQGGNILPELFFTLIDPPPHPTPPQEKFNDPLTGLIAVLNERQTLD